MREAKQENQKPLFGTKEWANYNINCVTGCSHDCRYCYAKSMAIRFGRKTPDNWKDEEIRTDQLSKRYMKSKNGKLPVATTTPVFHHVLPAPEQILPALLPGYLGQDRVRPKEVRRGEQIHEISSHERDDILVMA